MAKKRKLVLFRGDKPLWIIVTVLFLVSLLVVYSATAAMAYREVDGNTSYYLFRQARFVMIGFFVIIVVHWIDYRYYARYAKVLFQLSVVLVILAYVIGVSLNDAPRWIKIPGLGFTFQPSELLKVALVILLAQRLGVRQKEIARMPLLPALTPSAWQRNPQRNVQVWFQMTRPLVLPMFVATIVVLPANFSTAAIIWVTCLIMMMVGRVRQRELNRLILLSIAGAFLLVGIMWVAGVGRAKTWVNRVVQFVAPTEVVIDNKQSSQDSFQVEQAEIAIASGGFQGKGPGNSTQRSQLPHPYSDFAYAFIIEEYGFMGGFVVFVLYLWIFYRAGLIVRRCNRPSQGLMVLGLSLIIALSAFVNMAVSVGLMPVTGQSLPLISMGGSSVLFTCIAIGMILGVSRESERDQLRLEAEQRRQLAEATGADPQTVPEEEVEPEPPKRRGLRRSQETSRPVEQPEDAPVKTAVYDDEEEEDDLVLIDRGEEDEWGESRGSREVIDLLDDDDER